MTPADLRALSERATPGEWSACGQDGGGCVCGLVWSVEADAALATTYVADDFCGPDVIRGPQIAANSAFIAACANEIRRQLSEPREPVSFAVVDAEGNVGKLGWMPMAEYGRWTDYIKPREGWHIEYAYRDAALSAQHQGDK